MITVLLAIVLAAGPGNTAWYQSYEQGVRLIESGKGAEAIPHLQNALAARSTEALQAPARQHQYIDYLPHLYLAIAQQMSGNVAEARQHLAKAEASGVAVKSEIGRPLLVAYQLLLRGEGNVGTSRPAFATYSDKKPLLTEDEFNMLRRDVLTRCDLPPETNLRNAPWYANYELGLELERKGDYPRALQHFIDAVSSRPNPQRQARMYGMWLIDYYPYFHIARSHVRLENWECAKNALEISHRLGELPRDAPEISEYVSLQRETERRLSTP